MLDANVNNLELMSKEELVEILVLHFPLMEDVQRK